MLRPMSLWKPRNRLLRYAVRLVVLSCVVLTAWTTVYLTWNDDHLAHSINGWVSGSMRGHGGPSGQRQIPPSGVRLLIGRHGLDPDDRVGVFHRKHQVERRALFEILQVGPAEGEKCSPF